MQDGPGSGEEDLFDWSTAGLCWSFLLKLRMPVAQAWGYDGGLWGNTQQGIGTFQFPKISISCFIKLWDGM